MLDLYPGQETTSLLISPEGWLIGLCEIEAAEKGQLAEPPWCFVKTQFGPVEGHVALVEMLTALKREFLPNLEVHDEGDYWETRDLATLTAKIGHVQAAIDGLAEGLNRYGLSREAAEDQEILIARIERIAQLVHRTLARPAEHPPVRWDDEESGFDDGSDGERIAVGRLVQGESAPARAPAARDRRASGPAATTSTRRSTRRCTRKRPSGCREESPVGTGRTIGRRSSKPKTTNRGGKACPRRFARRTRTGTSPIARVIRSSSEPLI